jgi:xylulokinase
LTDLGVDTGRTVLLGGGARSRVWAEIRAGVLHRPVELCDVADTSPLGAALLAAVASGAEPTLDSAAMHLGRVRATVEPVAGDGDAYEGAYGRYRDLFAALKPIYGT